MKYPPQHHQESEYSNIVRLMKNHPLAVIMTAREDDLGCSHIPLVYKPNNKLGVLVGHMDLYNPQVKHFKEGPKVEILFNGPEVYISPSVYHSTQLPTWNYFKAHIKGNLQLIESPEKIKTSLIEMTAFLEGEQAKYSLDANNPRMAKALPYIIGFQIEITAWEGKYKISQDKHKIDQAAAKEALKAVHQNASEMIDALYANHQVKSKQP